MLGLKLIHVSKRGNWYAFHCHSCRLRELPTNLLNGPLTRYAKLKVANTPGMPGTFSPPQRVSDPDMHHGTSVTHVPWSMSGSLTSGFLWSRWRGKRSRHSRRMPNPQFFVSCKRPMADWMIDNKGLPASDLFNYMPIFIDMACNLFRNEAWFNYCSYAKCLLCLVIEFCSNDIFYDVTTHGEIMH